MATTETGSLLLPLDPSLEARASDALWRTRLDAVAASISVDVLEELRLDRGDGRTCSALNFSLSGTVDGWVLVGGRFDSLSEDAYGWFLDTDVAVAQEHLFYLGATRPEEPPPEVAPPYQGNAVRALSRFRSEDGAGLRLYLPDAGWSGRLCVLTAGSGIYADLDSVYYGGVFGEHPGELLPLAAGEFTEGLGVHLYAELLLDRGHAVAWVRKDQIRPPKGVCHADLEDGTQYRVSHHSNLAYTLVFIERAQREIEARLGALPELTLLYGHSSGGSVARLLNIRPEANTAADGSHIVDGIIVDDAGAGLYVPEDDRPMDGRIPQIDIRRVLDEPAFHTAFKRLTTERMGRAGAPHRYYEVPSVSHFDSGMSGRRHALDTGGFVIALWDLMERWCTGAGEPPPSQPVLLPQAAWPLGEWSGRETEFEPFIGLTEHWRRLGLLAPGEEFSVDGWRARLVDSARALATTRLFSNEAAQWTESHAEQIFHDSGARP